MVNSNAKDFQVKVGVKVREVRNKTGLSYETVAAMIPMKAEALRRIEKGYVAPHVTTLKLIADALQVDIKDFL